MVIRQVSSDVKNQLLSEVSINALLTVQKLDYGNTPTKVYNFEVADTHTYVVGSSQALVHNNCFDFDKFIIIHKNLSLRNFKNTPTKEIVDSLFSGDKPLLVGKDGRVWKGNERIQVLQERGYDMNKIKDRLNGDNLHEPHSIAPWED